ncbi:MAG TPA: polyprenyl synthetase family protein [Petrimonas sp.]|uniref:polyprenyl synthetase family protein n=1 Tax=Petrimonas sp. TaxID=2023866 RepID=UPI00176A21D4|nr:polyprenyl synthetase family protein [Petrimonas sp.]MEA5045612.1 polyprenyl synthetase family protein [Petrimonas sp.]HHV86750.1 polyprenyl synthetase family protein [Petrimonas sp.]
MLYSIDALSKKIEEAIQHISFGSKPGSLYDPISYALSVGGKRVRPLLVLLAANMFGGEVDKSLKPAIGIEIFHNFTLLHDDLMDKSDMRRGMPAVHKKWDANAAILSGDAMLIESYRHIASVHSGILPQIISLFSQTAMEVCQGQQLDMDFEKRSDVTESEYIEMITLKTAVLLACSSKMGALLANASLNDAELLYNYGINIGLAFQLKDDLLDVYGDSKTFGKNIGGDIVSNKKTYLLIKALKTSDKKQYSELLKWISAEKFDKTEKIESVKNIYNELNLKIIAENLIEKYYLAALDCLSSINVADERKKELISLSENLMYREK